MAAERIAPDTLITQTNLSGSITDIDDDPDSPDGNWLTADDDALDTVCLVGFASPVGTLTDGADLQEFKAVVRRSASGGNNPNVDLSLYESGTLVRLISSDTIITSDTGQIVTATWNANELAGDGSNAEFHIHGDRAAGSPAVRRTVEIGAVEWNAEVDAGRRRLIIS